MEFCDECGSMMKAKEEVWVCGKCSHEQAGEQAAQYVITEGQQTSEIIESGDESTGLPTTDAVCPECGHGRAEWYIQQIRSADESETRFLICKDCRHKWREDDH